MDLSGLWARSPDLGLNSFEKPLEATLRGREDGTGSLEFAGRQAAEKNIRETDIAEK